MSSSAAVCPVELCSSRDVRVDLVRGVAGLVEGDGADRDQERRDDGREDRVDDEHCRRAGNLEPRQVANERVQREGDDARRQEQEEDVPERPCEEEDDEQEDGEDDELDPSRDLDRRAGAGHRADRTAGIARRPSGTLLRSEPWRLRALVMLLGFARTGDGRRLEPAGLRSRRSSASSAIVTLALTAFDNQSSPPAVSRPAPLPVTSASAGLPRARDRQRTSTCSRPSHRAGSPPSAFMRATTARSN